MKRCDELERKLRYFSGEIDKFDLEIASAGNVDAFLNAPHHVVSGSSGEASKSTGAQLLEGLETELEGYEAQLRELNSYSEKLTIEYNQKVELLGTGKRRRREIVCLITFSVSNPWYVTFRR